MADFPLMLAGPIVRRQEPKLVAIWVALSKSASVAVNVYEGGVAAGGALPATVATGTASTVKLGDNLHVVVVVARTGAGGFTPGLLYSYNVQIAPDAGATTDLKGLGLLDDTVQDNGYKQPALGYIQDQLPGFVTPPASLADMRIIQGSCRKPHSPGRDAIRTIDDLIDPTKVRDDPPLDVRPHMMFLTGDQIYADDVAMALLHQANIQGQAVLGGQQESLNVGTDSFPATLAAFPAGFRNRLTANSANLTSGVPINPPDDDPKVEKRIADSHLLSFGEFCGMYLLTLSSVLWPAQRDGQGNQLPNRGFDPPTIVNAPTSTDARPADVNSDISTNADQLVIDDCHRRQKYCGQLDELVAVFDPNDNTFKSNDFVGGLGQTRRVMANIATYMIFDDHEVTDDWYLTLKWKKAVLGSPLGLQVVRNALLAYTFFQGWGNDPDAFATGGVNAGYFTSAVQAVQAITGGSSAQASTSAADLALGIADLTKAPTVKWHYQLLDPSWRFGVLVLDERTRRGYGSNALAPSDSAPPALIAPIAMTEQIPNPLPLAGRDVLFVIAPAPVLGVPVVEELFQPGYARVSDLTHARRPTGQAEADQEPWSQDPDAFENLLRLLAPAKRIVLLSGDVHFAHGASLTYWQQTDPTPSRFAQFTSSAVKNLADDWELDLIRSLGFAQRIFRSGAPTARLGWQNAGTDPRVSPLTFPGAAPLASYPLEVRVRFRHSPVLLPAEVWGAGVTFTSNPDWRWRLELVFDPTPDEQRVAEDRPSPLPDFPTTATPPISVDKLPDLAQYHFESMKQRGISRQTVFTHNIGVVSIAKDATTGVFTATHTILSTPIDADDKFKPITVHTVVLDIDPTTPQPGLQAP